MTTGHEGDDHRGSTAASSPPTQDPSPQEPAARRQAAYRPGPDQDSADDLLERYHHGRPGQDVEPSRGDVLHRQKERFGGIKWGSAFFGWLTAIGTAVLLFALLTAIGAVIGVSLTDGTRQAAGQAAQNTDVTRTAGIAGAIVAAAVLLIAYYCGGYVAGRMARFNGVKQGLAVWVWTIVITVVVAILAAVAGDRFDVISDVGGLPKLPVSDDAATITVILGAVVALVVALVGAILGGLAGMRFHRKVDRTDLGTR
ncbi:hypothetical protein [Amycolatopsis sp. WQ 127309]|uniref:hypothetical protein n=1 Tax=Amycolatopsis sp. WQ 127309 TaxID=2932773 RepID=UPI001FF11E3F|nr:hypothetical protein [Amycolatopsis sp. WQ 127309]UOZ04913.1 hypothetical protein MUY22_39765 [Amycolatopsis sp. WQ 127309]